MAILHLIMLTIAIYLRPGLRPQVTTPLPDDEGGGLNPDDVVRFVAEIFTVLGCLLAFIMQAQEIKFLGLYLSSRNLVS